CHALPLTCLCAIPLCPRRTEDCYDLPLLTLEPQTERHVIASDEGARKDLARVANEELRIHQRRTEVRQYEPLRSRLRGELRDFAKRHVFALDGTRLVLIAAEHCFTHQEVHFRHE